MTLFAILALILAMALPVAALLTPANLRKLATHAWTEFNFQLICFLVFGRAWLKYRKQFEEDVRAGMYNQCDGKDIWEHLGRQMGIPMERKKKP